MDPVFWDAESPPKHSLFCLGVNAGYGEWVAWDMLGTAEGSLRSHCPLSWGWVFQGAGGRGSWDELVEQVGGWAGGEAEPQREGTCWLPPIASNRWCLSTSSSTVCVHGISSSVCVHTRFMARLASWSLPNLFPQATTYQCGVHAWKRRRVPICFDVWQSS